MGYNLLINGIYRGYNLFTNHLLSSWDIQVGIQAHRNWEWWTMEPKYQKRFVSVMKYTPIRSSSDVRWADWIPRVQIGL